MFSILKSFSLLVAIASVVFATPVAEKRNVSLLPTSLPNISLNKWGGFNSLDGFDNFHGAGNFFGVPNFNELVIVQQQICQAQQINILQQQLAIIQELTKQVILSQICDVEVQLLLLQQHLGVFDNFKDDIFRRGGRQPGFDRNIAGLGLQLFNNGGFNVKDFGFNGRDLGKNKVTFNSNWDDKVSPFNLDLALKLSKSAGFSSHHV
jgi:hypothetical protein